VKPRDLLLDAVLPSDELDVEPPIAQRGHERRDDARSERTEVSEVNRPCLASVDPPRRVDRQPQLAQSRLRAIEHADARPRE
jgi:hypothetical protein